MIKLTPTAAPKIKQSKSVLETDVTEKKLYVAINKISAYINNKPINAVRGDRLYLTDDEFRVIKDSVIALLQGEK